MVETGPNSINTEAEAKTPAEALWDNTHALEALLTFASQENTPEAKLSRKALRNHITNLEDQEAVLTFLENALVIGLQTADSQTQRFIANLIYFKTAILTKDDPQALAFANAPYSPEDKIVKKFLDIATANKFLALFSDMNWRETVEIEKNMLSSIRKAHPHGKNLLQELVMTNPQRAKTVSDFLSQGIKPDNNSVQGFIDIRTDFPWNLIHQPSAARQWSTYRQLQLLAKQSPRNTIFIEEQDLNVAFIFPNGIPQKYTIETLMTEVKTEIATHQPAEIQPVGYELQLTNRVRAAWAKLNMKEPTPNRYLEDHQPLLSQFDHLKPEAYEQEIAIINNLLENQEFDQIPRHFQLLNTHFKLAADLGYRDEQRRLRESVLQIIQKLGQTAQNQKETDTLWQNEKLLYVIFTATIFNDTTTRETIDRFLDKLDRGLNPERRQILALNLHNALVETKTHLDLPPNSKLLKYFDLLSEQFDQRWQKETRGDDLKWRAADDLGLTVYLRFLKKHPSEKTANQASTLWNDTVETLNQDCRKDLLSTGQLIAKTAERATPQTRRMLLHLLFEACPNHPHLNFLIEKLIDDENQPGKLPNASGAILDKLHNFNPPNVHLPEDITDVFLPSGLWNQALAFQPNQIASLLRHREQLTASDQEIVNAYSAHQADKGVVFIANHNLVVVYPEELNAEETQKLTIDCARILQEAVNIRKAEMATLEQSLAADIYPSTSPPITPEVNPADEDIFLAPTETLTPSQKLLRFLKEASFAGQLTDPLTETAQEQAVAETDQIWSTIYGPGAIRTNTLDESGRLFFLWPDQKQGPIVLSPAKKSIDGSDIGGRLLLPNQESLEFLLDRFGNLKDLDINGPWAALAENYPGLYFQLNRQVVEKARQAFTIPARETDQRFKRAIRKRMASLDEIEAGHWFDQQRATAVRNILPQLPEEITASEDNLRITYPSETDYQDRRLQTEELALLAKNGILYIEEVYPLPGKNVDSVYKRARPGGKIVENPSSIHPRVLTFRRDGQPMLPSQKVIDRLLQQFPDNRLLGRRIHYLASDGTTINIEAFSTYVGKR